MKNMCGSLWISALLAVVLAAGAAWWGIPHAYAQRGYFAVGGEWFLIVAGGCLPFICSLAFGSFR